MLCRSSAKEYHKKVWIQAVEDFEHALSVDEVEAFTCNKCPSEDSEGDGKDEVHIEVMEFVKVLKLSLFLIM